MDIDLYLRMGAVSTVSSPSHPVSYAPTNDNSGKIRLLPTAKELLDLDLVLRVNTKEPIESLLPACYVEKQEGSGSRLEWINESIDCLFGLRPACSRFFFLSRGR